MQKFHARFLHFLYEPSGITDFGGGDERVDIQVVDKDYVFLLFSPLFLFHVCANICPRIKQAKKENAPPVVR